MEYGHDRAVADGVNVDYQVFRINTAITERGSTIEPLSFIGKRERRTRAMRWEQIDEDLTIAQRNWIVWSQRPIRSARSFEPIAMPCLQSCSLVATTCPRR